MKELYSFEQALELYQEMLVVEKNVSRHTLESYSRDLKKLSNYLQENKMELADVTLEVLRGFAAALYDQNLSARSAARIISSCRGFFQFLVLEGQRENNPAKQLEMPKHRVGLPKILSVEEVTTLIQTAHGDETPEGLRLTALLEILYATGLRVSELISLPFSLFRDTPEILLIRGKGDKERYVPIGRYALKALQRYLTVRDVFISGAKSHQFLFPSRGAQGHLTRQRFGQLLKDLAVEAGLDPAKLSPHVIRHAFASHLLHNGADLVSIQKMLGHSDLATTQIYTHVMKDKLIEAVTNFHPLSQKSVRPNSPQ
tara:strand:- start:6536 stop:7477 length:942 start_codon:yes stop_codon:yes gene_type:complete